MRSNRLYRLPLALLTAGWAAGFGPPGQEPGQEPAQEPAIGPAPEQSGAELAWDARAVEHLLNRAGFGARTADVLPWVEAGPQVLVEHLLAEREGGETFYVEQKRLRRAEMRELSRQQRAKQQRASRRADQRQLRHYLASWVTEMAEGADPLRERMALFWHGFFTSSYRTVKNSRAMIRQNQFLRDNATGSYADLLAGILRDPAMLRYLDNVSNKKSHPNENLAREVMELFSLGEGNYTERDVKNAARALTGHAVDSDGEYRFVARQHDRGDKQILGVRGRHDAGDLVEILLEQEACARFVARELIAYLEGVAPSDERLERYAALLREGDYELKPFLRALFLDPDFYREDVVGARVLSPVDYLVGSCRRLGLRHAPAQFVIGGASLLGQQLFDPPNVKGWEEGEAWVNTSTLMLRGNLVGMLLGQVELADMVEPDEVERLVAEEPLMDGDEPPVDLEDEVEEEAMGLPQIAAPRLRPEPASARSRSKKSQLSRMLVAMNRSGYRAQINVSERVARLGLMTDAEVVDYLLADLLAIEPPQETRAALIAYLAQERAPLGLGPYDNLPRRETERVLRRLMHLILSLPEAQLG